MTKNNKQKNIHADWQFFSIGNVLDYEQPTPFIVESTKYKKIGTPVLTAGKTFILGHTDEKNGVYQNLPVIIFDDFTTAIKYVDFPFKVKSSAMKILKNKPGKSNIKFIFGWMQTHKFIVGEHKRNYLSEYQYLDILLPPIEEQNKIVQTLEVWDNYLEKLNKKIELKKQIKKGLSNFFLYKRKDVDYFSILELFYLGRGRVISKNEIKNNSGEFPVYSSQTSNDGILGKINTYDFDGNYITWTTDGANAGRVYFRSGKFNCTNVCGVAKLKESKKVNLYYITSYLNYITHKYVSYVGNPKLMNNVFGSIIVGLPSIEKQNHIADILSSADREIESLEKKKKIIEAQKKFLLNNLISGKIRHPEFIKQ
jgi:type I restriction enzyme S subunit